MNRLASALSVVVVSACSVQMRAESSGSGAGSGAGAGASPKPEAKADGKGKTHSFSTSFHESGHVSAKIDWQGRSGRVCRAATPFKFVGTAHVAGKAQLTPSGVKATGKGEASGTSSGGQATGGDCSPPRTAVPPTPPPAPVKEHPPFNPRKPTSGEIAQAPVKPHPHKQPSTTPAPTKTPKPLGVKPAPAKPEPEPPPPAPAGPTPAELEKPVEPPAEPPPNVFGYDKPVLGCFEGQVFPLEADAKALPKSYDLLQPVSVLYACEWDIAPRSWDQGFPGISERFEWFAIRYAGAFRIVDAGEYGFRISSDDGTKLIIDGKQVIDNDGQHPPKEARGKVQLSAGDHQMVLEYFQGPRFQINLQLWVTPPGKSEELFTVR